MAPAKYTPHLKSISRYENVIRASIPNIESAEKILIGPSVNSPKIALSLSTDSPPIETNG